MTEKHISVEGNAKINLTLDILGTRPDGFHEVSMVMQEVSLHDTLELTATDGEISLSIECLNGAELEADETNLCWRAVSSWPMVSRWWSSWRVCWLYCRLSCSERL